MASTPAYAAVPNASGQCTISTANTARDGTGTIVKLFANDTDIGANGTRVDTINIVARGTTTAGVIRMFAWDGATYALMYPEILVSAVTPSTTIASWAITLDNLAIHLNRTGKLRNIGFSTNNAETFIITATRAGDF